MIFRRAALALASVLVLTPLTATSSSAQAAEWRPGWCRADEGLSVVVDYATVTGPQIPEAGWDVRCIVGGSLERKKNESLRLSALRTAGFEFEAQGNFVTSISGAEEYANDDVTNWMFFGAPINTPWDINYYDIASDGPNLNKALGASLSLGWDLQPPRATPQFGEPVVADPPGGGAEQPGASTPVVAGSTPRITGSTRVGANLKVVDGQWSAGAQRSHQWLRNGAAIPGATAPSYRLTAADLGRRISVTTTGTLTGHGSTVLTSAKTGKVARGTLTRGKVTIAGTAKVGKTLRAKPGAWKPKGVRISYTWQRNGTTIKGATKSTYKLKQADRSKRIRVKVTARKTGYTTRSVTGKARTVKAR